MEGIIDAVCNSFWSKSKMAAGTFQGGSFMKKFIGCA
jgi:hypothetical protein